MYVLNVTTDINWEREEIAKCVSTDLCMMKQIIDVWVRLIH